MNSEIKPEHMRQFLRCYSEISTPTGDDPKSINRTRRQGLGRRTRKQERATERAATRARQDDAAPVDGASVSSEARAISEIERPYGGCCLVLDTETTVDERQALRVGFYIVCGISHDEKRRLYRRGQLDRAALDTVIEQGMFYNSDELTSDETTAVAQWARAHAIDTCQPVRDFVRNTFYRWIYKEQALCIGHNAAFDLTRLATEWGAARGDFRGGFTFKLCDCPHKQCFAHPSLSVKHVGAPKNLYEFRASGRLDTHGKPAKGTPRGHVLDTMTLGRAVLGPGQLDLYGLAKRAGVPADKRKVRWDGDHGGAITPNYLDYNSRDVFATWELYKQLRGEYRKYSLRKGIQHIISEASVGKGLWSDIGVPRFLTQHRDFPKDVIGHAMEAYYGGRSEVHIRLQPVDVIHADYKSEYPTVNALMGTATRKRGGKRASE